MNTQTTLYFGLLACLMPAQAALGQPSKTNSGFITTPDGVNIHYLEAGTGSPILFVPGWTMPAWIWEQRMAHFAKTHRVVAMDPRSQGLSSQTTEPTTPQPARAISRRSLTS
jgi:microsomal epoxide hydrolase